MNSLDILEKLVKLATRDFGPSLEDLEKKGISINHIKQDLEVFKILLKYIRFEKDYKDYCGHNEVYEYSRIILYCLNDSNIYHNRDKVVNDFNIVRNYILTNKVGDSQ